MKALSNENSIKGAMLLETLFALFLAITITAHINSELTTALRTQRKIQLAKRESHALSNAKEISQFLGSKDTSFSIIHFDPNGIAVEIECKVEHYLTSKGLHCTFTPSSSKTTEQQEFLMYE